MIKSKTRPSNAKSLSPSTGNRCWLMLPLLFALTASTTATAGDWPTYRHDRSRSGMTSETLKIPLAECWVYRPQYGPEPAWDEPNPRPVGGWFGLTEKRRVHFDDAFHVVGAGDAVFFGSSADGRVVALDAKTGQQRWCFLTGGPVRLAPTIWKDNVYFGSDDGFVYCVRSNDGEEVWKFRAAPSPNQVLGSGKMISLWPVRTGVLVDEGIAYFGSGVFPAEGVYLYAVDANDGRLIWCNDTGGETPQSRVSPQGYLLASKDLLFSPNGRVSPAAYDRRNGELKYQSYTEHIIGGTNTRLADDQLFTGTEQIIGYAQESNRNRSSWFWSHQLIVSPDTFYAASGRELAAIKRKAYGAASLRRKGLLDKKRDLTRQLPSAKRGPEARLKQLQTQIEEVDQQIAAAEAEMASGEIWRVDCECEDSLVLTGNVVLAGGNKKVVAHDVTSGKLVWKAEIDGKARGLAVADGRLFVSSDTGTIYCFGSEGSPVVGVIEPPNDASPFATEPVSAVIEAAAERIIKTTGIDRGYCLILGCGTGRLAFELAKRTQLQICGAESDLEKVKVARRALNAAGLYGSRVVIEHCDLSQIPFSDYFANLVVSESAVVSGQMPDGASEAFRMLKPLGGKICIGQPAAAKSGFDSLSTAALQKWQADAGIEGATISNKDGLWLDFERGVLPGAGSWTHQYAEPGNTTCSDDELVRGPLGVLWFGEPGPNHMPDRHRRAAAPLSINGRLFVLGEGTANRTGIGENSVRAYDAYNGLKLWERRIRGALRVSVTHDSGNSAVNDDSLFVTVGDGCVQLDAATGETKHTHKVPPASDGKPRNWGFIAVVDDVLYGSRTEHGRTADCVFAIDVNSGRQLWKHEVAGISQGSIAISNGRFHFAASSVTADQRKEAISEQVREVHRMSKEQRDALMKKLEEATVYNVVALDAKSGKMLWEKPVEITGAVSGAYWCSLGAICTNDTLVLFGVFLDGHYWTQFFQGKFESRQVVALSATDGYTLWRKPIGYRVRPIVVGKTLHAEPWAFDLHSGEQLNRVHPVTGRKEPWQFARPGHHCGAPAASPHMLLFRSLNLGWYDLDKDFGTQHFGGQRTGCWINFIPANGLLMMPEASSGCMCAFPNICTVVFKNREENRQWAYFSQPGPMTPVKHLGLNLGAPGDRKAPDGLLWLGYPRPRGSLVLQYQIATSFFPDWSYFKHDPSRLQIDGTDTPWVFRSGINGVRECKVPVAESVDGKARYTVRLAFAELVHNAAGKRVFDIKVQDKVVAKDFDVFQQAGAKNRAVVKEFKGIDADTELTVEFVSTVANPAPDQLPVLQGIEIEREQVLTLGVAIPSFLLNDGEPQQAGDVVIVNNKDNGFAGMLRVNAPKGFTVTPAKTSLNVPAGERETIAVKATVAKDTKAGKYKLPIELLRSDGTIESRHEAVIEHLGDLRRVVVTVAEDAHVGQSAPTTNYGTSGALNVDGGDRKLGDHHHGITYLKFPLQFDGKPVSAKLRLHNAGNPSGNSGQICLVAESWTEKDVTYNTRPKLGKAVAKIGAVTEHEIIEIPLDVSLDGMSELSLAIDPTGCDGINYISREGGKPAELIVEYIKQ